MPYHYIASIYPELATFVGSIRGVAHSKCSLATNANVSESDNECAFKMHPHTHALTRTHTHTFTFA